MVHWRYSAATALCSSSYLISWIPTVTPFSITHSGTEFYEIFVASHKNLDVYAKLSKAWWGKVKPIICLPTNMYIGPKVQEQGLNMQK